MVLASGYWASTGRHVLLIGAMALAILIVMHIAGRTHSGHTLDHRGWVFLPPAARRGRPAFT